MMDIPVLLVKQDFNRCYTSTQLASRDHKVGVLTAGAMLWTLSYIAPWTHFSELCMEGVGGAFSVLVLACETILYTAIDFSGSWLGTWSGHLSSALHENTAWCSVIYTSVGWLDFATAVFLTCLHACACAVPRMHALHTIGTSGYSSNRTTVWGSLEITSTPGNFWCVHER